MSLARDRFRELLAQAVIGGDRLSAPSPPRIDDPFDQLLSAIDRRGAGDGRSRELLLLDRAATAVMYRQAGRGVSVAVRPLPKVAQDDPRRGINAVSTRHLEMMLTGDRQPMLPEWLDLVAAADQIVPARLLPDLLAVGTNDKSLRRRIAKVVGQRGYWLADQNPEWSWVRLASADEVADADDWREGNLEVRRRYLERLRASDPAAARSQLQDVWARERASERTLFLGALEIGLSLDDETMLESCLDDRSKEVRSCASNLLARLPGSSLAARVRAHLAPWLRFEIAGGLRRLVGRGVKIHVDMPSALAPAVARDGVVAKPPQGKGERAWWLEQLVAMVPPSVWTATSGATIADLVTAARQTDWTDSLISGWTQATIVHRDPDWAAALIELGLASQEVVWAVLTGEPRDRLLAAMLSKNADVSLLAMGEGQYSDIVAQPALLAIETVATREQVTAWNLPAVLGEVGLRLPVHAIAAAERRFIPITHRPGPWVHAFMKLINTLRFRAEMADAIQSERGDPQR